MGRKKKEAHSSSAEQGKRVILYTRVSTDEQVQHGYGLDAQLERCQQYALLVGYTIVATKTDEGLSGTLPMKDRAGLLEAFTLCIAGEADMILTYAQDRYARDTGVWVNVRDAAIKSGIGLWTVKENTNFATKDSQFMGEIHAVVNAQERRTIAERLFNGRRQRSKDDGLGSGPLPYGFVRHKEVNGVEVVTTVHLDEAARPVIRLVLAERKRGTTYQGVADLLTHKGYKTPRGHTDWQVSTIQAIEKHEQLYRTGVRTWDDVQSLEKWPVLLA